jgi:WD40 repeat protein
LVGQCHAVAFSHDSNWLAAGTDAREIPIWAFKNGWHRVGVQSASADQPASSANVSAIAFSPDNRILAYGTTDSKIFLWSVNDGQPRPTITGHRGSIWSIAFSPNGKCLASGSTDGTMQITPTAEPRSDDDNPEEWIPFGKSWSSCVGPAPE